MAVARIKLLRNKREVVIRQIRRDIALLLESGQDATARIRVTHLPLLHFAFNLGLILCILAVFGVIRKQGLPPYPFNLLANALLVIYHP